MCPQVQHLTSETSQQTGSRLLALYEYEHLRAQADTLEDMAAAHHSEATEVWPKQWGAASDTVATVPPPAPSMATHEPSG